MNQWGIGVLAGCLLALGTMVQAAEKSAANLGPELAAVVKGNNEFALDLYGRLRTREGNLFFSPESISTALAMTYAGARGQTAEEMAKTLHFSLEQDQLPATYAALVKNLNGAGEKGAYQLRVANALWGQKGHAFLPDFLKVVQDSYGAGLNQVDFVASPEKARQTINAWVEKETNDKIQNLLAQGVLTRETNLVLTNAIYFKGTWVTQFNKTATRDEPFLLADGGKVSVPMMNQKSPYKYFQGDAFQVLEMPYQGNDLSMAVFLPREVTGLADLEKQLTAARLADWQSRLRQQKVIVTLPRFKLTEAFQMENLLAEMGMPLAFNRGEADFSAMDGQRDMYLSAVVHKAFVDVNEEGTEAAAATGVVRRRGLAIIAEEIPVFRADHPFLFLIRDNRSGSIVFLGRVVNPMK